MKPEFQHSFKDLRERKIGLFLYSLQHPRVHLTKQATTQTPTQELRLNKSQAKTGRMTITSEGSEEEYEHERDHLVLLKILNVQ